MKKIGAIRLRTLCSNQSSNPRDTKRPGVDEPSKRCGIFPEFFTQSLFFSNTVIFYQRKIM